MVSAQSPVRATGAGRVGLGTANGTFGELLQGALPGDGEVDGEGRFLVTLPVARWSTARFEVGPAEGDLTVSPAHKTKAAILAGRLLTEVGRPVSGRLLLHSSIPEGKGLASSSADLVATARAVLAAVAAGLSTSRLAQLIAQVEPTDGVMYRGVVAFDHRRGVHLRSLGHLPALQVVAVDQGGHVDTVSFNRHSAGYSAAERRHYRVLLDRLATAVATGDLLEVGRVSTESALLNQERLRNRNLAALNDVCRAVGGIGLVACHSGTMAGILIDPRPSGYRRALSTAVRLVTDLSGQTHLYRTLESA